MNSISALMIAEEKPKATDSIWQEIINEEKEMQDCYDAERLATANRPHFPCQSNFFIENIVPELRSAIRKTCELILAKDANNNSAQFFNGVDSIAEFLYRDNPMCPKRLRNWNSIYEIFDVSERVECSLHWVLTPDEAATMIQALIRGFLVRRRGCFEKLRLKRERQCEIERNRKKCLAMLEKNDPKEWDAAQARIADALKQRKSMATVQFEESERKSVKKDKNKKKDK